MAVWAGAVKPRSTAVSRGPRRTKLSIPFPVGADHSRHGQACQRAASRRRRMTSVLRLASFLAENARPIYERIAAYLGSRLGIPTELVAGAPWDDLDAGGIDVAFICGLPYARRHDRPDRPLELLCAPVLAAPRYGAQPVYFTEIGRAHV